MKFSKIEQEIIYWYARLNQNGNPCGHERNRAVN